MIELSETKVPKVALIKTNGKNNYCMGLSVLTIMV